MQVAAMDVEEESLQAKLGSSHPHRGNLELGGGVLGDLADKVEAAIAIV
jgi:hypothetical protein